MREHDSLIAVTSEAMVGRVVLMAIIATWCLEGNPALGMAPQNILKVRDWLGHSSVEESERYAHVNSVNVGGALDGLGAVVGGSATPTNGAWRHSVSLAEKHRG